MFPYPREIFSGLLERTGKAYMQCTLGYIPRGMRFFRRVYAKNGRKLCDAARFPTDRFLKDKDRKPDDLPLHRLVLI